MLHTILCRARDDGYLSAKVLPTEEVLIPEAQSKPLRVHTLAEIRAMYETFKRLESQDLSQRERMSRIPLKRAALQNL
ncbi:MAG: hypothetical protein ACE10G_14295 [Gemmatimonadales bacterium]